MVFYEKVREICKDVKIKKIYMNEIMRCRNVANSRRETKVKNITKFVGWRE